MASLLVRWGFGLVELIVVVVVAVPLGRWCFGLVLLARWGFGLVQLIVVVVVAVSLVRWGFVLDAAGGDAVAAFESDLC